MSVYIELLSVSSIDAFPCVIIATDKNRYLINCGEGTQRLCVEHKMRISKLKSIFLTSLDYSNVFGLPGMLLTAADNGSKDISIVGPHLTSKFWKSTRFFMRRNNLNVSIQEITSDDIPIVSNSDIIVRSISIKSDMSPSLCYIVETPEIVGRLDIKKIEALGVPKGPLLSILKGGKDITLPNGSVVRSIDVVGESEKSRHVAVICDVSMDETLLNNLISCSAFDKYRCDDMSFDCMIHLSKRSVLLTDRYIDWMSSFGATTVHIVVGEGMSYDLSPFHAVTGYCQKLRSLCPNLFVNVSRHLNEDDYLVSMESRPIMINSVSGNSSCQVLLGAPQFRYVLSPAKKVQFLFNVRDPVVNDFQKFQDDIDSNFQLRKDVLELPMLVNRAKNVIESHFSSYEIQEELYFSKFVDWLNLDESRSQSLYSMKSGDIWFLGTGSALPCKYRNVSGICVSLDSQSAMLLDVGEGTWLQLLRMARYHDNHVIRDESNAFECYRQNHELALLMAKKIKMVYISHPHADHHLGIITVIAERKRLIPESEFVPLLVVAPPSILAFLYEYECLFSCIKDAYLPLSTRLLDASDPCESMDPFWNHTVFPIPKELSLSSNVHHSVASSISATKIDSMEEAHQVEESEEFEMPKSSTDLKELQTWCIHSETMVERAKDIWKEMKIKSVQNTRVTHCWQSYGVAITILNENPGNEDIKIVYSGDTRPCSELVELGKDATILIHEATFENMLIDEAIKKQHSTTIEALSQATKMNAFRCILTHFSQRYPNAPPLEFNWPQNNLNTENLDGDEELEYSNRYPEEGTFRTPLLAFDFLSINFLDLLWAPILTTKIICNAFPSDVRYEEDEDEDEEAPASAKKRKVNIMNQVGGFAMALSCDCGEICSHIPFINGKKAKPLQESSG